MKGKRPFRWRVYERQGGDVLATSDPFALLVAAGEIVRITLAIPAAP